MDETAKATAEARTEAAIAQAPVEDFRGAFRDRLRWLKDNRADAFASALSHYNDVLVPNIARGSDPIEEWITYGRRLGELSGPGKTVSIDETGRSGPFQGLAGLVLHLPDDTAVPALALAVPRSLSDAQKATLSLLVRNSG